jgi:5-methylcytosine-specific restriction endonuclease McrA
MSVINRTIVLKLNRNWQAMGVSTVAKAIVDLSAGQSAEALDFDYEKDENDNYILDEHGSPLSDPISAIPVNWATWIMLPVRPWEMGDAIHYGHDGQKVMRAPTVLIAKNYYKMPRKSFKGKPSKDAIFIRDNGVDQYTGKKLKRDEATVDHIIPKSKGGRNEWENLALTSKDINSRKGNKLNSEAGLKLLRQPKAPRPMTAMELIRDIKHPTWKPHLPHLVEEAAENQVAA